MQIDPHAIVQNLEALVFRLALFVISTATMIKIVIDHWPWTRR